jgi:hypothetical protein
MEDFRCKEPGCKKLLGKIDKDGVFHFESTRMPESFEIKQGTIVCKNNREHQGAKNKIYKFKQIKTE